jgi:5'-nucleotidase
MRRTAILTLLLAAAVGSAAAPASAAPLRILVTNDDGVGAPGISRLVEGLRAEPDVQVSVVAPMADQSGSGSQTRGNPAQLQVNLNASTAAGYPAIAVGGYPADAVNYALYRANATGQPRPDLVISGINAGSNPAPAATLISGTIGAALTASRRGLPALATSQSIGSPPDYASGVRYTLNWLRANRGALRTGVVFNMNIPTCRAGRSIAGQRYTNSLLPGNPLNLLALLSPISCRPALLPWTLAADVDALAHGYVSLSKIPT